MDTRELKQIAKDNLSCQWGKAVGITLLAGLLGGLIFGSGASLNIELEGYEIPRELAGFLSIYGSIASILTLVQFIVSGTVQLGYADCLLKQHRHEDYEVKDLFGQFHRFGDGFAQSMLRGLFIVLWSLLLIVPGIIKAYGYAMTPFIMAEHPEMRPMEAMKASEKMMQGHKWELFMLGLSFFGWALLSALTLGIGSLFLNPYINAAYAAFYKSLGEKQDSEYLY